MTGPDDSKDPTGRPGPDDVGSVGEEAARLFGALADLARQHTTEVGGGLAGMAGQAASMAQEVNEHLATGAAECRYCLICRVVHTVRETSPEVRAHLMVAASSLMQAAAALMEKPPPEDAGPHRGPEVERIDLDDGDERPEPGETP